MQQAIDYEVRWQIAQIEDGHAIQQATVLFDPDTGETRSMRTKEDAADYRYFPDPDLPPLVIGRDWVEKTRSEMSELPRVMAARFVADYGLPEYDAGQLTQSKATAAFFEAVAAASKQPKLASNWVMGELSRRLNGEEKSIEASTVNAAQLAGLITASPTARFPTTPPNRCLTPVDRRRQDVDALIEAKGLKQMSDTGELEKIIDDVLAANAKNVEEVRAGNAKAMNALVGQAMKATKGKANPAQVNELLKKKLGA
jgi:aspartyl-tRNA(Asn)/glutamyl-tRNA(Gln) amidotransferase subunit B